MAVCVAPVIGDLHVQDLLRQGTERPRIGTLDEISIGYGLNYQIKALGKLWEHCRKTHTTDSPRQRNRHALGSGDVFISRNYTKRELFKPYSITLPIAVPPTYEESVKGRLLACSSAEQLATARCVSSVTATSNNDTANDHKRHSGNTEFPEEDRIVDLSTIEGIRTCPNKKAKQAAKQAQRDKWADSDNEGSGGADGAADGNNDGAGGGDGGSGAGGDPPDGNGGDDPMDWGGFGTSKKDKKKKKKAAWFDDEDEESKPQDESKPAEAAAETDPLEDFGAFAPAGKKKKAGKKSKEEEIPVPPPPPEPSAWDNLDLGAPAATDANAEDDWGGFTSSKSKKKGKKGKNDPTPATDSLDKDMKFDDINLNDDKSAPKLDLDLGLDGAADKKSSGFSFGGGWGGGWGSTSSWGFGGIGDSKKDEPKADDSWGFTSGKSSKKKATSGFDFNFDNLGGEDDAGLDLGAPTKPDKTAEEDAWGTTVKSKDKKKTKKGVAVEPEPVVDIPPPPPVASPPANDKPDDDPWAGLVGGKKDKKSKKKNFWETDTEPTAPVEPEPEVTKEEDSMWDFGTSSKDKKKAAKKAGKGVKEEPIVVEVAPAEPEPAPIVDDFEGWGTSKKDKKKKKSAFDWGADPDPIVEVPPDPPAAAGNDQDDWLSAGFDTGKKSKKGKKGAAIEEIPVPPEPVVEDKANEDILASSFGSLGKKDKKSKKGAKVEELPPPPPPPPAAIEEPKVEEDDWMNNWTASSKTKDKKSKAKVTETVAPAPDPIVDKPAEDDLWGSWGTKKTSKKSSKKDTPPPAPTPPDQGLDDPVPDSALLDLDDPWTSLTKSSTKKASSKGSKVEDTKLSKTKSKDSKPSPNDDILAIVDEAEDEDPKAASPPKDEKKPKSSGWGLFGSGSKSAPKPVKETEKQRKEREKQEADNDFAALLGDDNDLLSDELTKKPSPKDRSSDSKKKSEKLTKTTSKSSKSAEPQDDLATLLDEPEPEAQITDPPKKADGWGFWGSSLKSSAKTATTASAAPKEIGSSAQTTKRTSLTEQSKMPESNLGDELTTPKSATTASGKLKSTSKGTATSTTVQDRVKALQGGEKESGTSAKRAVKDASSVSTPPPPPADQIADLDFLDKPSSRKTAGAGKASSSSKRDKKDSSLVADPASIAPPKSTSPLPGGFPGDDLFDSPEEHMAPSPKKPVAKDKKSSKISKKDATPTIVEAPAEIDLLGDETKLPTPPPEKASKDDPKPGKKERPRVVRDQQSSSWGLWGAAPPPAKTKKSSKEGGSGDGSKDGDASPAEKKPSLSRSKSERKASTKDPVDKISSGSDKEAKASKSRPSTSRGMSFGGMFGGSSAAPSRSKSTRDRRESRRESVVQDSGLLSPPPDDAKPKEMSDKAAKVLGVSRSKSTREKTKSRKVPDPDPIDDDLVVVDNPEDSGKDVPQFDIPKKEKKRSGKSRRQSTMMSGGLGEADDEVMVDAPRQSDESEEFVKRPSPVKRTSTIKKGGLMGGLFGALGARPTPDRRQSKVYESEDGAARRKRGSVYEDDSSKRLRREERKVGRSQRPSDHDVEADVITEDVDTAEAKEARRAERRARKDREAADEEAKASRRREREEARKAKEREERERSAKEEDERQARRQEDRKARRAQRQSRHVEEDRAAAEEEAKITERRDRRREKEREIIEEPAASRPKADRRQSYVENPDEEEARKLRREERRLRRGADVTAGDKERPRASRRRSDYPAPIDGYFDRRNGEHTSRANGTPRTPLADGRASTKVSSGNDKTANWVNSVNDDPPPPPPVEGTIVDAPMHHADENAGMEETTAREFRKKRRNRDGYVEDAEDDDRWRRRDQKSSDESSHERRKSYAGYGDNGVRTWDGRPANPRRGSWFKKIAGL